MYLQRIFGKDVNSLADLAKVPNLNMEYLDYIDKIMEKDYKENIGKDADFIDDFYAGKQWMTGLQDTSTLTYNSSGNPIWHEELAGTYNNAQNSDKPKLVINLVKDAFTTLSAMFNAIDPMARAVPENPSSYDEDQLRRLNITSEFIFYKENNFKVLYDLLIIELLKHRHGFLFIKWNPDYAKTPIPVCWEFIQAANMRVDPSATDINKANYLKHKFKLKYGELKYKYKIETTDKKNNDTDDIEISHYWFKVYLKADAVYTAINEKVQYWVMIPVYNGKFLKTLNDQGKPEDVVVYPYLPFVCFRGKPTQFWYGDQVVSDLIPLNMEYNLVESEEEWNFRKVIDKPLMGTLSADKLPDIKRYGTFTQLEGNENVRTLDGIEIISAGEFNIRKQSILQNFYRVIGNIAIFQGQTPVRISSGKMLETLKESAELKPNQMEQRLFDSIKELFVKSVLCIDDNNPTGLNIFDPYLETGRHNLEGEEIIGGVTKLTEDDIKNSMWTVDIVVDDSKLLSNNEKFAKITSLMQYGNLAQLIPASTLLRMVNGSINGLISDHIIDAQEKKEQAVLNPQQPIPMESNSQGEISPETFRQEIDNTAMEMKNNNVPDDVIAQILSSVGIDENYNITNGNPPEQVLADLKLELSNKVQDIYNQK